MGAPGDPCAIECVRGLVPENPQTAADRGARRSPQQEPFDISVLYRVRDEVLGGTVGGPRYTNLYYTHSPAMILAVLRNPTVLTETVDVLRMWQPNLKALVSGQGATATISGAQVQALETYLGHLSEATGSDALRQAIADERARTPLGQFDGKTMEEARAQLLGGYVRYLPAAAKGAAVGW